MHALFVNCKQEEVVREATADNVRNTQHHISLDVNFDAPQIVDMPHSWPMCTMTYVLLSFTNCLPHNLFSPAHLLTHSTHATHSTHYFTSLTTYLLKIFRYVLMSNLSGAAETPEACETQRETFKFFHWVFAGTDNGVYQRAVNKGVCMYVCMTA